MDSPEQLKSTIRAQIRLRLKQISADERAQASNQACNMLRQRPVWQRARVVLFYSPLADELDLSALWQEARTAGQMLALPRYDPERGAYTACLVQAEADLLLRGRFGILEPSSQATEISSNQLDLTLVPGVAFDSMGRRVGRGKGYYDRLLKEIRGAKCGVGFEQQIWPGLPMEPHDIKLDYVLTPTRWIECG